MKQTKYLWIHQKNPDENILQIIDDPIELFKTGQLNEAFDKIYQIGQEVKIKVSIEQVATHRSVNPTKDGLGVGDYRG
jgi:hypothetical protein